jgi:hypothetical protein
LLLDDNVTFDSEDAAALTQVEQFYQLRVDVQLMAVFAQAAGNAEAETFASVGQSESRIEARAHQAPAAAWAAFASPRSHRDRPQDRRPFDRSDDAMLRAVIDKAYDSLVPL